MKIYLSEEQYIQLVDNGSITVGDVTIEYNEEDDYLTPYSVGAEVEIDTSKIVTIDTDQTITGKKTFDTVVGIVDNTLLQNTQYLSSAIAWKASGTDWANAYKIYYPTQSGTIAITDDVPTIYTNSTGTATTKTLRIYTDTNGYLHIATS